MFTAFSEPTVDAISAIQSKTTKKMKTILSLCLLFASFLSSAYAQNTTSQAIEDRRYKAPSDAVGALGPDLFGEQVDHNTGATSFSVTDIDLPGNNALPVRLTRTMKISVSDGFPHLVPIGAIVSGAAGAGFSGWSIEVPNLSGVFTTGPDGTTTPQNYGWKADSATPNARCSTGSGMPPRFESLDGIAGEPYKYWSGTRLSVPGQVSGDILLTTTTSQNNTAQAARWTTKDHWLLTCLPTIQNGSGEGFLAISPDGTKYYFNRMIVRNGINRYSRIPFFTTATGGTVKMNRGRIFLAATRVEDRFGNFVSYNYDSANKLTSISASDGRLISFTYNSSSVLTSAMAHGKTWTFQYGADQKLLSVTLPDTSKWVYTQVFTSGLFRGSIGVDDPIVQVECDNGLAYPVSDSTFSPDTDAAQVTVQHPSGAAGTFVFRHREYYNPWAGSCTNHEAEPLHYIDALVSKKINGPGLVDQVWTYDYDLNTWKFAPDCLQGACPTTRATRVTQPDGSVITLNFKLNGHEAERGQLASEVVTKNSIEYKRTVHSNVTPNDANLGFNTKVGVNPLAAYHPNLSGTQYELPSKQKDIIQDGVTFTWKANSFDYFARANSISLSNSLNPGFSKTDTYLYQDDTVKWVLGQLKSTTNSNIGDVVSQTDFDATSLLPIRLYEFGSLKETLTYNTDGTLASVKNANDGITYFANYKRGIPQLITNPDNTTVSAVVSDFGKLTSISNELGFATSFSYDAMNRLSSITPPASDTVAWLGTTQTFSINALAAYGLPAGHWKQTISKGNYRKEIYFNARWQPVVTREYDNSNVAGTQRFTRVAYDTTGRTVFTSYPGTTDALTSGVRTEYDSLGRVTKTTQDSELGALDTTTEYLTGFVTRVTNPRGFATTTSYHVFDAPDTSRPQIIVAPEGITTTILRNVYGKTLEVTRSGIHDGLPINSTRKYVYDNEQRLCKRIEPESGASLMDYDAVDNLIWSVQGSALTSNTCDRASVAAGDKTVRTYNTMNRVTAVDVPGTTNDLAYSYFADGALQTLTSGTNNWTYTYNKLRLPVTETLTIDSRVKTLTHAYNTMAQESSLTYPSGLVVASTLNALGQASQAGTYASGVSYFSNGGMSGFTYGNGIVHSLTQNARFLPLRSKDMNGAIAILDDTYAFDANGNVASITDGTAGNGGNRTMSYDDADRLIQTNAPNQSWLTNTIAYDALDNIRVNTLGNRTHHYQYNATTQRLDQLTLPDASVARHLAYDAAGNVTTNGAQNYMFDKANRLENVVGKESYEYDGHGRRVKATRFVGKNTNHSMYSLEGKLITEEDARSGKNTDYIYLNGSLVAKRSAPFGTSTYTVSYQHTDSLGSPVAESDASKTVTKIERYTPYGEPSDQGYDQGPGYTGHVTDAATGLTYAQQRYYDPLLGVFLSGDPVTAYDGDPRHFNRYAYAYNNPYKFSDPDGRIPVETVWDAANVMMGVNSAYSNFSQGNIGSGIIDSIGVVVDTAATLTPYVPGGAGTAIRLGRGADAAIDTAQGVDNARDGARFIAQPDGTVVDVRATPPGSYDQPNGSRTDVLQGQDHGAGRTHTHDRPTHTKPQTGETFRGREDKPGRPVSFKEAKNIEKGTAPRSDPKRR